MSKPDVRASITHALDSVLIDDLERGGRSDRPGFWHVTDFASACHFKSALNKTKIPRQDLPWSGSMLIGTALHHLAERNTRIQTEIPVVWDVVKDKPVKLIPTSGGHKDTLKYFELNGRLPHADGLDTSQFKDTVFGTIDRIVPISVPGFKGNVLVDLKTLTGVPWLKPSVDPDHVWQVNIYNYLQSKAYNTEPLKMGCVQYLSTGLKLVPIIDFAFELMDVKDVRTKLLAQMDEMKQFYTKGIIPSRVEFKLDAAGNPIKHSSRGNRAVKGDHGGRPSWACDFCPYTKHCLEPNEKQGGFDMIEKPKIAKKYREDVLPK